MSTIHAKSKGLKEIMRAQVPCAAQHRGSISPLYCDR